MPLTEAGYTVISIKHRAAPRFRYPALVEDARQVVTAFVPGDLLHMGRDNPLLGVSMPMKQHDDSIERRLYAEASPISHVSPRDPPFLLIHGDADQVVPFDQSEKKALALEEAGVHVRLLRIFDGIHDPNFCGKVDLPDYLGEMVRWFDCYL